MMIPTRHIKITRKRSVYERAIGHWGISSMRTLLIEDTGELLSALSKERRGSCDEDRVAAKLVDLQVALNSVKTYYVNAEEWKEAMKEAEEGLERRLNQREVVK